MATGKLELKVHRAEGLGGTGKALKRVRDPMLVVRVDKEKKNTKVRFKEGGDPKWDQSFTFNNVTWTSTIWLQCYDGTNPSRDRLVGEVQAPLAELMEHQTSAGVWVQLTDSARKTAAARQMGKVLVHLDTDLPLIAVAAEGHSAPALQHAVVAQQPRPIAKQPPQSMKLDFYEDAILPAGAPGRKGRPVSCQAPPATVVGGTGSHAAAPVVALTVPEIHVTGPGTDAQQQEKNPPASGAAHGRRHSISGGAALGSRISEDLIGSMPMPTPDTRPAGRNPRQKSVIAGARDPLPEHKPTNAAAPYYPYYHPQPRPQPPSAVAVAPLFQRPLPPAPLTTPQQQSVHVGSPHSLPPHHYQQQQQQQSPNTDGIYFAKPSPAAVAAGAILPNASGFGRPVIPNRISSLRPVPPGRPLPPTPQPAPTIVPAVLVPHGPVIVPVIQPYHNPYP